MIMKHTVKPANPASSQATDIKGKLVGRVGIEPTTKRLRVSCSTS